MYDFESKFGKAADKYALPARKERLREKIADSKRDRIMKEFYRIRNEITKPMVERAKQGLKSRGIGCELIDKGMPKVWGQVILKIAPKDKSENWNAIAFYTDAYFEKLFCSTQYRNNLEPSIESCPITEAAEKFVEGNLDRFLHTVLNDA